MNNTVPDGSYLVYSLRVDKKSVFAHGFSIMEVQENGNKLTIETFTGDRTALDRQGVSDIWVGGDFRLEAAYKQIKSNNILVGKAIYKPTSDNVIEAFAAIELQPDLSPIVPDNQLDYEIFFKNNESSEDLTVTKISQGKALKFEFTFNGTQEAETPGDQDQSPGRFNADKKTGDYNLCGFVLPHYIREGNQTYRVLVGHASKSQLPTPDDIEPYVAVASSSGEYSGDEG